MEDSLQMNVERGKIIENHLTNRWFPIAGFHYQRV
jgi:hypothetical protein